MLLDSAQELVKNWVSNGFLMVAGSPKSGLTSSLAALAITRARTGASVLAICTTPEINKMRAALSRGFQERILPLDKYSVERTVAYDFVEALIEGGLEARSSLIAAIDSYLVARLGATKSLPARYGDMATPSTESIGIVRAWGESATRLGCWNDSPFAALVDASKAVGLNRAPDVLLALADVFEAARDVEPRLPIHARALSFDAFSQIREAMSAEIPDGEEISEIRRVLAFFGVSTTEVLSKNREYLAMKFRTPDFKIAEADARDLRAFLATCDLHAYPASDALEAAIQQRDPLGRFRSQFPDGVGVPVNSLEDLKRLKVFASALKDVKLADFDWLNLSWLEDEAGEKRVELSRQEADVLTVFKGDLERNFDPARTKSAIAASGLTGFDAVRGWRERADAKNYLASLGSVHQIDTVNGDLHTLLDFHQKKSDLDSMQIEIGKLRKTRDDQADVLVKLGMTHGYAEGEITSLRQNAPTEVVGRLIAIGEDVRLDSSGESDVSVERLRELKDVMETLLVATPRESNAEMIEVIDLVSSFDKAGLGLSTDERQKIDAEGEEIVDALDATLKRLAPNDVLNEGVIERWESAGEAIRVLDKTRNHFEDLMRDLPESVSSNGFESLSFIDAVQKLNVVNDGGSALRAHIEALALENELPLWADAEFREHVLAIQDKFELGFAIDEFLARCRVQDELRAFISGHRQDSYALPTSAELDAAFATIIARRCATETSKGKFSVENGEGVIHVMDNAAFLKMVADSEHLDLGDDYPKWTSDDLILIDNAMDSESGVLEKVIKPEYSVAVSCLTIGGNHEALMSAVQTMRPDMRTEGVVFPTSYAPMLVAPSLNSQVTQTHHLTPVDLAVRTLSSLVADRVFMTIGVFCDSKREMLDVKFAYEKSRPAGAAEEKRISYYHGVKANVVVDAGVVIAKDKAAREIALSLIADHALVIDDNSCTVSRSKSYKAKRNLLPPVLPLLSKQFDLRDIAAVLHGAGEVRLVKSSDMSEFVAVEVSNAVADVVGAYPVSKTERHVWLIDFDPKSMMSAN